MPASKGRWPLMGAACSSPEASQSKASWRLYELSSGEITMTHTTAPEASHEVLSTQEMALHMIASAARVLLMIGTAVLVGEVAAGPTRRLLAARRTHRTETNTANPGAEAG
jgi:hypothetical protein